MNLLSCGWDYFAYLVGAVTKLSISVDGPSTCHGKAHPNSLMPSGFGWYIDTS